ncbi:MAG: cupin domain-containing protein [Ignavibacteriales bacterium]|nr:cupin domain-containing protein [Ignavibacteriales bacterium]
MCKQRATGTIKGSQEMNYSGLFVNEEQLTWVDVGGGVTRKILGYDSALMMVRVKFQEHSVGAMHSHPHRQVTFVEKGSFEVQIAEEKRLLRAGDSFFIPSGVEHGVVALEEGVLVDVFTPMREDFLVKV